MVRVFFLVNGVKCLLILVMILLIWLRLLVVVISCFLVVCLFCLYLVMLVIVLIIFCWLVGFLLKMVVICFWEMIEKDLCLIFELMKRLMMFLSCIGWLLIRYLELLFWYSWWVIVNLVNLEFK